MFRSLRLFCLGLCLIAFAGRASSADSTPGWRNPLVPQRADPHVTLVDGRYYLAATVPEYDRIELRRAATLDGLRDGETKTVWRRHDKGPMSWHIWAPELHRIDGKWYLYFAAGKAEAVWDIRMWVLECAAADPLAGEWVEKGQIKTPLDSFSLDATTFVVRDQRYLSWAQRNPDFKNSSSLYLAKMDTPWSIAGPAVMISKPELPWECVKYLVNEGPAVLVRHGRVFLTYSASATDANYCMGLLTADENADLLDPKSWTKSPLPVFASSEADGQFGPGHNSFTTSPDGETDISVYHARNYRDIRGDPLRNPDRHTRAQVVTWRADGTPDFGVPVADAPLPVKVSVAMDAPGVPMALTMHGLFFEDINFAADGGLYAELVQNRSFEGRTPLFAWSEVKRAGGAGELALAGESPLHANNPRYLRLASGGELGAYGVANSGFGGIAVRAGENYRFEVRARRTKRASIPDVAEVLRVQLEDELGAVLAEARIGPLGGDWLRFEAKLTPTRTTASARLVIAPLHHGSVDLDVVSLFPEKTFKGRRNGLRADLAQLLAELKPGFLRFPGGCIVEGADFHNMYRWKDTIGDIAERRQNWNLWRTPEGPSSNYEQTYGLGFFEYFQLCEDLGAAPVPIVNVGLCCQARQGPAVPLAELQPFVQDALDLIEFANGPVTSAWGAKRAAMGHPAPFGLTMLGVGNEQWDEPYFQRYAVFYAALKKAHPEITLITTAGPHPDDQWWRMAWTKFKSGTPAEVVDEHYYRPPHWFLTNSDRYDSYDRKGPKVFAGEFAAHDNRRNNLRSALAEAAYMTGLWRNAEVVTMAAYAPLFAKQGFTQWEPNLIWFDNTRSYGTPSYHAQALFARNRPDVVLPVTLDLPAAVEATPVGTFGLGTWFTAAEFKDIHLDAGGRTVVRVNPARGLGDWELTGPAWAAADGVIRQGDIEKSDLRASLVNPAGQDYVLSLKARRTAGREGFLIHFDCGGGELGRWNVGGWDNTFHALDVPGVERIRYAGTIENGRWYDVRIEVTPVGVKCFLDGALSVETPRTVAARKPVPALFVAAGRRNFQRDWVLQVVNPGGRAVEATVDLAGGTGLANAASVTVLTGQPGDENSLEQPAKVAPSEETIELHGATFTRVFAPNSATTIVIPLHHR